jgi:hypothetical protein
MTALVEERVRAALAARAGQITAADLQPALPPSALGARAARRRPVLSFGRFVELGPVRGRGWMPVLAGIAVAAVAVVFAVVLAWHPRQSTPPGRAPYLPGEAPASVPAPTRSVGPSEQPRPQPTPSSTRDGSAPVPGSTRATSPAATEPGAPRSTIQRSTFLAPTAASPTASPPSATVPVTPTAQSG